MYTYVWFPQVLENKKKISMIDGAKMPPKHCWTYNFCARCI